MQLNSEEVSTLLASRETYEAYKNLVNIVPASGQAVDVLNAIDLWMDRMEAVVYDLVMGKGFLISALDPTCQINNDPVVISRFIDLARDHADTLVPHIRCLLQFKPDPQLLSNLYYWISEFGTDTEDAVDALILVHNYGVPYPPDFMSWLVDRRNEDGTNCEAVYDVIENCFEDGWGTN